MRNLIFILCWLASLMIAEGTTRVLTFVHQPLTTLGTAIDAGIVVARVPVLTNSVPEGLLSHVASPNKILQDDSAGVVDSNILSLLGISVSADLLHDSEYTVTIDLRGAGDSAEHGVDLEAVVVSTIECINKTIIDTNVFHFDSQKVVWHLKLKADPKTLSALEKYQQRYEPRKSKRAEQVKARQTATAPDLKSESNRILEPESEECSP